MTERERLFEWCVDEIEAGRLTFEQCVRRYADSDPELVATLRTIRAARMVVVDESHAARMRVRARMMAGMNDVPARATPTRPVGGAPARAGLSGPVQPPTGRSGPLPMPTRRQRVISRVGAIAAAVLLALGALGWGAGNAAAASLPGEPLYAVKQAQEWVALRTAWSDQRRGVVLVSIADHRLAEATIEANRGHDAVARVLTNAFDGDIQQAISLSVAMAAHGQDNRSVLEALGTELARAQTAQTQASTHGENTFAQSLGNAVAAETQAIDHNHLKLPNGNAAGHPDGRPTETPESGMPEPGNHGQSPHATPTPHAG